MLDCYWHEIHPQRDGDLLQLSKDSFTCWFMYSLKQLKINVTVILRNAINKIIMTAIYCKTLYFTSVKCYIDYNMIRLYYKS